MEAAIAELGALFEAEAAGLLRDFFRYQAHFIGYACLASRGEVGPNDDCGAGGPDCCSAGSSGVRGEAGPGEPGAPAAPEPGSGTAALGAGGGPKRRTSRTSGCCPCLRGCFTMPVLRS
mmetsp:Transcript_82298/g.257063  ORF Transcript_82298/g.257063 Transcript_82298/m.257063 type:complete len:119 (-) Transcript_82298:17-373(-)